MSRKVTLFWLIACLVVSLTAAAQDDKKEGGKTEPERRAPSLGIDPAAVTAKASDLAANQKEPVEEASTSTEDWNFGFHGYFYAPLRLGIVSDDEARGGGTTLLSPPPIPEKYTDWKYLHSIQGPWAELKFSYGNSRATANVIIAAWNITSGGYRELMSQLGINQAFVTLTFPRVFGSRGGLLWNVGVFQNRYGSAGRYDAGKYGTYLFGETHVAGETLTAYYDVTDDWTAQLEHGIGVKIRATPPFQNIDKTPAYLPYSGPVDQGTNLVHHLHAGMAYRDVARLTGHYLTSWTDDADKIKQELDGRITVLGGEFKWTGGIYGDGFIGYGRTNLTNVNRLSDAIELLHSQFGWEFRDNYFPGQNNGTNSIDTIAFQYTYSLATLLWYPNKFWGQGPDLTATIFGMFNNISTRGYYTVSSTSGPALPDEKRVDDNQRLKFGGELTYIPIEWFAVAARYDLVQPDLDDSKQSFHVLSPKLIFRTGFLAHEQVIVQYSRYINGDKVVAEDPWDNKKSAENVFTIAGLMWW